MGGHIPAIATGQADGHGADLACDLEPEHDIARASRGREADDNVVRKRKRGDLPREDHLIRIVICYSRHARVAVGKRQRGQRGSVHQIATHELGSQVGGLGRTATVAHEDGLATAGVGLDHRPAGGRDPCRQLCVRGQRIHSCCRLSESPTHKLLHLVNGHLASRSAFRAGRMRTRPPLFRSRRGLQRQGDGDGTGQRRE